MKYSECIQINSSPKYNVTSKLPNYNDAENEVKVSNEHANTNIICEENEIQASYSSHSSEHISPVVESFDTSEMNETQQSIHEETTQASQDAKKVSRTSKNTILTCSDDSDSGDCIPYSELKRNNCNNVTTSTDNISSSSNLQKINVVEDFVVSMPELKENSSFWSENDSDSPNEELLLVEKKKKPDEKKTKPQMPLVTRTYPDVPRDSQPLSENVLAAIEEAKRLALGMIQITSEPVSLPSVVPIETSERKRASKKKKSSNSTTSKSKSTKTSKRKTTAKNKNARPHYSDGD